MQKRWWVLTGCALLLGGAAVLIGQLRSGYPVPPAPAPANDAHGDPLPPFARARLGQVHHPRVGATLAFDADTGRIVSLAGDGLVHWLDPESGEVVERIRLWERQHGELTSVKRGIGAMFSDIGPSKRPEEVRVRTLSPDGKRVAALVDGRVVVWDLPEADRTVLDERQNQGTNALAFSPDGLRLAIGRSIFGARPGGEVVVLDVASGGELHRIDHPFPNGAALAADGSTLAITGASVHVVDLQTGALRVSAPERKFANRHVKLSPDASRVASIETADSSSDSELVVRDAETGDELWRMSVGRGGYIRNLTFSPDGALLAVAGSPARVLATGTGEVLFETPAAGFAFSPDGKRLFGSSSSGLHAWTVGTWEVLLADPVSRDARGGATDFAFFADGSKFATAKSNSLSVWDARSGAHEFTIETGLKSTHQLAISPDGRRALIGSYARARADGNPSCLVDLVARTVVQRFDVPAATLLAFVGGEAVAISPSVATSPGESNSLEIRPIIGDGPARSLTAAGGIPAWPVISDDRSTIAATAGGTLIHVWDVATGKLRPGFPVSQANHVALSATGDHVLSYRGEPFRVHDARDGSPRMDIKLRGSLASDTPMAISPDGRYAAIAGMTHFFELWDVDAAERAFRFEGHTGRILRVAFSPDGRTIATSSHDGTLLLWDLSPWLDDE